MIVLLTEYGAFQLHMFRTRSYIIMPDLDYAIRESVDGQLEAVLEAYRLAVTAPRGIHFKPVLLACALASKDDHGFFYANNVTGP